MIIAQISGVQPVISHLTGLSAHAQRGVEKEVKSLVMTLLRKVKEEKLSGGILRNRTGTLRRSINRRVEISAGAVVGSVGTNLSYARVHELGYQGTQTIREHLRLVKVAWGRRLKNPQKHPVRTHTRQVNFPERSFLRSSLNEMAPEIRARLVESLRGVL